MEENKEKIGWKDLIAIMIAQFTILFPIAIGAVVVIGTILFIFMKLGT